MSDDQRFLTLAPDEVYQAGQQVADESTPAERLADWFRDELLTAEQQVRHHEVTAAVSDYRETWVGHARRTAGLLQELGSNTSSAAVTLDQSDQDTVGQLRLVSSTATDQQSLLSRPIDGRSVIT